MKGYKIASEMSSLIVKLVCLWRRLVRDCGFDRVNTAAYSPRPDTPAAEWANQVNLRVEAQWS